MIKAITYFYRRYLDTRLLGYVAVIIVCIPHEQDAVWFWFGPVFLGPLNKISDGNRVGVSTGEFIINLV